MEPDQPASPPNHLARVRGAVLRLLVTLAVVVVAACSQPGASTPQELFGKVRERVQQKRFRALFELHHEEAQRRELKVIQDAKVFLRQHDPERNENMYRQFNYSSLEEFMRADPVDIWVRHNDLYKPTALDDAKLGDEVRDPQRPSDVLIPWWDAWGGRWMMRARRENGRWLLMDLSSGKP